MPGTGPFEDVRKENENLKAILAVRDHFLSSIITDIYENTGQLLSAARVRLTLLEQKMPQHLISEVDDAGKLLGQSITNLRSIGKGFYPEQHLQNSSNFIDAINNEVQKSGTPDNPKQLTIDGSPFDLDQQNAIRLFQDTLQMLEWLQSPAILLSATISYKKNKLELHFNYTGKLLSTVDEQYLQSKILHQLQFPGGSSLTGNEIVLLYEGVQDGDAKMV